MSASEVPSATIGERVAARRNDLSAAERKVAGYLADNPEEVAFASAGTLGRLTETSDATVIRTVKSLGYSGLPALKRTLQDGIRERLTPAGHLGRSLDTVGAAPETVLEQVLAESIRLLERAQGTVRPDTFAEAVHLISAARETLVVGMGGLGMLGNYLTLRLIQLGRHARSATGSGYLVADDLLRLGPDDVLVVIAHEEILTVEIAVAVDRAADVGAKVVLITNDLGAAIADRVTVSVSAPVVSADMFSVNVTTLAILDALVLAVSAQDRDASLDAMHEMKRLRDKLRAGQVAPKGGKGAARSRRSGRSTAAR
jgi:DNA-binding MurR/RpiR family transcriptional regulator